MVDVNTGTSGTLRVTASVTGSSAAGIWWDIAWSMQLIERVSAGSSFQLNPKSASVSIEGVGTVWSGTYTFDWRPSGLQSQTIASGTTRVYGPPSGSGANLGDVTGWIDASGTQAVGGPTSATQALTPPQLTVLPGTPSSVAASRVSDTQTTVSWAQSSATNGQPTSNTVSCRINDGSFVDVVTISPATSTTVTTAANQKLEYRVKAANSVGETAWSSTSTPIYTTPAAPSAVSASKDSSLNINVSWTSNVAYSEHQHEVWHGTVTGGVTTWDASALATVNSGTVTYQHSTPDPSKVHVYRIRAKAGSLLSAYTSSNEVQLLTAPAAPSVPAMAAFADRAVDLLFTWVHNPLDTTAQTAYEFSFSTNGGSTWSTTGKVTSTTQQRTIAANTYAADVVLVTRVRTWGRATSGGSDGTGASPWSSLRTVTFKTKPVASVVTPANGSTWTEADLHSTIGFSQAEGGTFVSATLELKQGSTVLETVQTTNTSFTAFQTEVLDGQSYTISVTVLSSHGITSTPATSTFSVSYTTPVPAVISAVYLPNSGSTQISVQIPVASAGQEEVDNIVITRTIDGETEFIQNGFSVTVGSYTFLDTTPTINGVNNYVVTTVSDIGAKSSVTTAVTTSETKRAFLSKGPGFSSTVVFGGNLSVEESLGVASTTVQAAGRTKPIGLYGKETSVELKVSSFIFEGFGSTLEQVRDLFLIPGKACYRDPAGRRVFGTANGSVSSKRGGRGDLQFTMTETS